MSLRGKLTDAPLLDLGLEAKLQIDQIGAHGWRELAILGLQVAYLRLTTIGLRAHDLPCRPFQDHNLEMKVLFSPGSSRVYRVDVAFPANTPQVVENAVNDFLDQLIGARGGQRDRFYQGIGRLITATLQRTLERGKRTGCAPITPLLVAFNHAILIMTMPDAPTKTTPKVIVYSSPTCAFCHMAMDYFKQKSIPYVEKDITMDQDALRFVLEKVGQAVTPIITIGDQIIIGFDRPRIDDALASAKNVA